MSIFEDSETSIYEQVMERHTRELAGIMRHEQKITREREEAHRRVDRALELLRTLDIKSWT
jgi:hypothetical protein